MRTHAIVALVLVAALPVTSWASPEYSLSGTEPALRLDVERAEGRHPLNPVARSASSSSTDDVALPRRFLAVLDSPRDAVALRDAGYAIGAQMGRVVSLYAPESAIDGVRSRVRSLRAPQRMRFNLDVNTIASGAVAARQDFGVEGEGVLVAVLDSGIDYTHQDFRNPDGTTRIVAIWDQFDSSFTTSGGTVGTRPPIDGQNGAPLGTVYTEAQINAALEGAGTVNTVDLFGHGTMVASVAAGNGRATGNGQPSEVYVGTAPAARIIAVRLGGESRTDTSISGDTVAALQWVDDVATQLAEPVVVNMSFGGHFGAHDGTTPEEIAISEFVQQPGRAVAVSAGNEGSAAIHVSGSLTGTSTLHLFNAAESKSILVDCWFGSEVEADAGFRDPTGAGVEAMGVPLGQCTEVTNAVNKVTACRDESSMTAAREVLFLVERSTLAAPVSAGDWQFLLQRLGGPEVARYDCWSVTDQKFTADIDPAVTVAQPGTSDGAITVGAWSARNAWPSLSGDIRMDDVSVGALAGFSSLGPTRDLRSKPDLVAGGQFVLAAWSIGDGEGSGIAGTPPNPERVAADGVHLAARGTSFSSPQVAGAVALLFERRPTLFADEIRTLLMDTATADSFTGTVPNYAWGEGKLHAHAAIAALDAPPTATPTSSPTPTPTVIPSGGGGGCQAGSNTESPLIALAALLYWFWHPRRTRLDRS